MPISFPGLFGDWEFNPDPIAIHVGHGIYWYGIILAFAMLAGFYLALKQCKRFGLTEDDVMDMLEAGATLVQLSTEFIYGGGKSMRNIRLGLNERLRKAKLAQGKKE
jgi:phosphatidylglycerol:prolipoprotein diacylglycerol transferase